MLYKKKNKKIIYKLLRWKYLELSLFKQKRKIMIGKRYNYITPSDTKGKEGRLKSHGTTIKTLQAESLKDIYHFPKIGQTAIQNKKLTRPYMQRHTMTEIANHSRSTVSGVVLGGGGGGGGGGVQIYFTWPQF